MHVHDVRVTVTEVDSVLPTGLADPFSGGLVDPFRATLQRPGAARTIQPTDLEVVNDLLELADPFKFTVPFSREAWDLCARDAEVQVWIDDSCILTGYIEERELADSKSGGAVITVQGFDKGSRLVADAAPLVPFSGTDIAALVQLMASPWFSKVTLSNARNREIIRGTSRKARALEEPALLSGSHTGKKATAKSRLTSALTKKNLRRKVEPGQSRGDVILDILEQAGWLAWSTADGKELFVGLPQYDQEPQWRFFVAGEGSARTHEANVSECTYAESNSEVFAKITVCGRGRGGGSTRAVALDNPAHPDGVGNRFRRPKHLLVSDHDIRDATEATARADREQRLRDARGNLLELRVPGFGQQYAGASSLGNPWGQPAIFACDTIADFEHELAGIRGSFYVTRVRFSHSKSGAQESELSFVPQGTELRAR